MNLASAPFLIACLLLVSTSQSQSSAFIPPTPLVKRQLHHTHRVPPSSSLHRQSSADDTERKRDKVRSLLVSSVSKAASLSKSVLYKGGAPIANVIRDAALDAAAEGGGVASEKLIELLNRIEGTLDRVEGEVNGLRRELKGVRGSFSSSVAGAGELVAKSGEATLEVEGIDVEAPDASIARAETREQLIDLSNIDLSTLKYEDIDYTLTDMAPPFINEDECLVPGEPLVRVEKAPQNSRRIFAGIDIPVSVEEVWNLLSDYENLQKVVPNLVVNEVLQLFPGSPNDPEPIASIQAELSDAEQCREIANRMKGAVLRQVGGAKVVGINFSARTTLEVREWPDGMPDFAHYEEEVYRGKSRSDRVKESKGRELTRYVFPRPFALSSLPHKDISMQSIENDDGEFRMYQGVWRMQPLPGCSPPGQNAMRLTYAVEVSPRPYLPVALVENRIAADLCNNLKAIREHLAV